MKKTISILMALIMLMSIVVPVNGFALTTGGISSGAMANHSFVIMSDNTVKAWGQNSYGQLGLGDLAKRLSPVTVPELTGVKQIVTGTYHSIALMNDGTVKAWGNNGSGQLGLGNNTNRNVPTMIPGLIGVRKISAGANSTAVVMDDGTVRTWGQNNFGQLGLGDTTNRNVPTIIAGLAEVNQVSVGENYMIILMNDGTVKSWGQNGNGELGIGNTSNKSTPTMLQGLNNVKQIVVGGNHTLAIMNDGTVKTWGYNGYGELGLGDYMNRTMPVEIPGLAGAKQIATGYYSTIAIMNDGMVKAWGYNNYGQLAVGNNENKSSPTLVSGVSNVMQIISGAMHTFAIMNDGSVKAWGLNTSGQLGLGDVINRTLPTTLSLSGIMMPVDEDEQLIALANTSVTAAESLKTQAEVDIALALVNALPNSVTKTNLINRLSALQSQINDIIAKEEAVNSATSDVIKAENTKSQIDIDSARALVNALHDSLEKTTLTNRLNAISIGPIIVSQEYKVADTKIDLAMSLPREPYLSLALLAIEKVTDPVEKAALVAEMQLAIEKSTASKPMTTKTANLFIRLAEITGRDKYITLAEAKTSQIADEVEKQDAITRMDIAKLVKSPAEKRAYSALIAAEQWKSTNMILAATKLVNALPDNALKTSLTERLSQLN